MRELAKMTVPERIAAGMLPWLAHGFRSQAHMDEYMANVRRELGLPGPP